MVGRQLGVDVVDASAQRLGGQEFLLVKRYDRHESSDGIVRLHQEDFCQALGVPTARSTRSRAGRRWRIASHWSGERPPFPPER
jgi:serine/threonine-protein kinase HipA